MTVVDLHNLHERAQRFVVGVVLAAETARKEDAGPGGLLFTMIDELNKYAPREGSSPIKDVLLDIAERGRSLGIILIGAQQTASEVERRIVSNSAIRVVGRLDSAEAGRPEYGFLPPSQRTRATLAKPGAMFISQPRDSGAACGGVPVPGLGDPAVGVRRRHRARLPAPEADVLSGCLPPMTTSRRFDSHLDHREERDAVKFLHTSDWHVGKMLKGRDRLDEQRGVLAEIAADRRGAPGRRGTGRRGHLRDRRLRRPPRSSWWSRRCCGCARPAPRSSSSPATTTTGRRSRPTGR